MRSFFFILFACIIFLSSCKKTIGALTPDNSPAGGWLLQQKASSIASPYATITKPQRDSAVLLQLNTNNTYTCELNRQKISQGSYSITTDSSYNNARVLQLNNFVTTGIFNLFTIDEVTRDGRILSSSSGFFMTISNDTLTLRTPYTPGGYIEYTFLKN